MFFQSWILAFGKGYALEEILFRIQKHNPDGWESCYENQTSVEAFRTLYMKYN